MFQTQQSTDTSFKEEAYGNIRSKRSWAAPIRNTIGIDLTVRARSVWRWHTVRNGDLRRLRSVGAVHDRRLHVIRIHVRQFVDPCPGKFKSAGSARRGSNPGGSDGNEDSMSEPDSSPSIFFEYQIDPALPMIDSEAIDQGPNDPVTLTGNSVVTARWPVRPTKCQ